MKKFIEQLKKSDLIIVDGQKFIDVDDFYVKDNIVYIQFLDVAWKLVDAKFEEINLVFNYPYVKIYKSGYSDIILVGEELK